MAELNTDGGSKQGGKGGPVRVKKSSTKIDMTPMVDLGFLLLTFFMLATTFNKPQVMEINMPDKPKTEEDQPLVNEKKVLSLVLGDDDKIYYYIGITDPNIEVTDYSKDGLRKVLRQNVATIPKLVVLIKPLEASRYKNIVDVFDEMSISQVPTYALVDISDYELDQIKESNL